MATITVLPGIVQQFDVPEITSTSIVEVLESITTYTNGEYATGDIVEFDGAIFRCTNGGRMSSSFTPGTGSRWRNRWEVVFGRPTDSSTYRNTGYSRYRTFYRGDTTVSNDGITWECLVVRVQPASAFPEGKQYIVKSDVETQSLLIDGERIEVWKEVLSI